MHGLHGLAMFEHYLRRLSQRGWGLFSFEQVDHTTGEARIALCHSAFALQQPRAKGKLCYMFAGWFSGAMDWVGYDTTSPYKTQSHEYQCAGEGHDHCVFSVTPTKG
jgi:predicted hydrocarbon binding protein